MLGSIRACATSYPTKVAEGLLWVWASSGPGSEAEAAAAEWKGLCGDLGDEGGDMAFESNHRWYFRDIPTGFVSNKENSFNDPSHGECKWAIMFVPDHGVQASDDPLRISSRSPRLRRPKTDDLIFISCVMMPVTLHRPDSAPWVRWLYE